MPDYTVAVVGTGPHPDDSDGPGYSMGYRHATGYTAVDGCTLTACVDLDADNAAAFGAEFDLADEHVFTDVETMLAETNPTIVSVCTPPAPRPAIVETVAAHDSVQAIHAEKPLATTYGDSEAIVATCDDQDVQLSVNLQHRCRPVAERIRDDVRDGAIGELERVEVAREDLLQTGIHNIDIVTFLLDDERPEWVLGQIDIPDEQVWYTDMYAEQQAFGCWQYANGVDGIVSTGEGQDIVHGTNHVRGAEGEIRWANEDQFDIKRAGSSEWETVECAAPNAHTASIETAVDALAAGDPPTHCGETALVATQIVFGVWESARRRGRVSLPLDIEGNPLEAMVESGAVS
jgi:predicted dehydrogenase